MGAYRVAIGQGGRVVIPAELRKVLGVQPGDHVVMEAADGELRLRSLNKAVADAQALIRQYIPAAVPSLVEELIAERREAALHD
jgi:AbrB family looped-hinge helix DNA binding protein